ncbi:GNAT family N-acetyltransferase [Kibdelosporangium philippinense]|uniref:GNAT family N-acetyltransferase n=1 Tax=Kibdelosporangium philippinense TaxID=211113 RepID=A0ABS8Z807_9PSEU|nr:GNAT family N-acetyltransferase [Kibdelosporangium philippinense]MCE7004024.1 GNAT family N-acetyltransferase [Kibdelosporangium philippinense]
MTEIRLAADADLPVVARLRWQWVCENGNAGDTSAEEFVGPFTEWARHNAETHRCLVAVDAGEVIGMAWLAIAPRVPTPRALTRETGDVQCVYVLPRHRDRGIGNDLVGGLLQLARELGLMRVTVYSDSRAVPVYVRHGFVTSDQLLVIDTH